MISPDGKWLLLTASAAGQQNLYVYSLDELSKEPAVARQLTSTPGAKRNAQFTPDSKEVYYLDRGRVFNVTLETARAEGGRGDRGARRRLLAREARGVPPGVDLPARPVLRREDQRRRLERGADDLRAAHRRRADAGRDAPHHLADARRAERVAHGHLGAAAGARRRTLGRLALDFDRAEYESNGRLRCRERRRRSARRRSAGIKPGDYLLRSTARAVGRAGESSTSCSITRSASASRCRSPRRRRRAPRDVVVKPIDQATEKALRYRQWVEQKRAYVAKASSGRLGYVHMFDMSAAR